MSVGQEAYGSHFELCGLAGTVRNYCIGCSRFCIYIVQKFVGVLEIERSKKLIVLISSYVI
jgi:hypothetical protein